MSSGVERCDWICPICGSSCGGIKGHYGVHQCPKCYKNYCEWSKCPTNDNLDSHCSFRYTGENCYTIYGHCDNKDFDFDYESTKIYKSFKDYEKFLIKIGVITDV